MKRLLLAGGLLMAFGFGIIAGVMLPTVKAGEPPAQLKTVQMPLDGTSPLIHPGPPTFPFFVSQPFHSVIRWQTIVVPQYEPNISLIILLDSQTGASYVLRHDNNEPGGYSWYLLDRK